MMYKAGVIGLGNIGAQFSLPDQPDTPFNHCSLYQSSDQCDLIAGFDLDAKMRSFCESKYSISVYSAGLRSF